MTADQYVDLVRWAEEWAPEIEFRLWGAEVNPTTGKLRAPLPSEGCHSPESIIAGPVTRKFYETVIVPTFPNYPETSLSCSRGGYVAITIFANVNYSPALTYLEGAGGLQLGRAHHDGRSSTIIPPEDWEGE